MKGPRKQVKTSADKVRWAMRCLAAARTLIRDAKLDFAWGSLQHQKLDSFLFGLVLAGDKAARLAASCDAADARRRAQSKQTKRKAA